MIWDNYDYSWALKHPVSSIREQLRHIRKPDMSELDDAMREDENLKKLMLTPLKRLSPNTLGYSYNYFSNLPNYFTLYHAVKFVLEDFFNQGEFYYSEVNGKLEGFVFYTLRGNSTKCTVPYIWDIGILSFDLNKNNTTLIRDVLGLFETLKKKYRLISWAVDKNNPAVDMYKRLIKRCDNGSCKEDPENPLCYRFYVE